MAKQNIVMDATMLTSLMSCARMTDFRHNHNLISQGGKSNSLEVGSLVHEVLETYHRAIIDGVPRATAIGMGLISGEMYVRGCQSCMNFVPTAEIPTPVCGHKPDKYPGVQNTPMESTSKPSRVGWKDALNTCEQYFDYYKNDIWVPLEVEKVLSKVLYEDDNIRILWKAKIDVLMDTNNGIYSVDHKTMKSRRDNLSLNNQFMGQCLLTERRGVWINKVGFQTSLKPEEKFTRSYISYTSDRLLEWQSEILPYWGYKLLEYSEGDYYPPNFTHCENKFGQCIYVPVCESDRGMREEVFKLQFQKGPVWDVRNDDDG